MSKKKEIPKVRIDEIGNFKVNLFDENYKPMGKYSIDQLIKKLI